MSGSTIGGVVGGVIGFIYGGPQGAQVGWMIGSAVGGYVDPDVIEGPRLTDPQQQTASEGAPIPLVYGTACVVGTIIQCQSEPTEHSHKKRTGKGGPVQKTYTYTRTVAIAICRAAPLNGTMRLRRVWVNGKLAYDASGTGELDPDSAKMLAGMTFYSGSETQTPDPDLEALPAEDGGGVGNVPAYRGLCYAVLRDLEVNGGAVPQFRWEVTSCGSETAGADGGIYWNTADRTDQSNYEADISDYTREFSTINTSPNSEAIECRGIVTHEVRGAETGKRYFEVVVTTQDAAMGTNGMLAGVLKTSEVFDESVNYGDTTSHYGLDPVGPLENLVVGGVASSASPVVAPGDVLGVLVDLENGWVWFSVNGEWITWSGHVLSPLDYPDYADTTFAQLTPGMYAPYGQITAPVGGAVYGSLRLRQFQGELQYIPAEVDAVPWAGDYFRRLPGAPGYYVGRNSEIFGPELPTVTSCAVPLDEMVGDLIERAGVTDYDVSALSAYDVRGLPITQPTNAAGVIRELQKVFFFDLPEWGNGGEVKTKLRAVMRGGASVLNLSDDDLVESDEEETTRAQSVEFPRRLNFIAADPDYLYEPVTQTAERVSENVKATSEVTLSTAVVFTRDEAAQRADISLRLAWEEAAGRAVVWVPESHSIYTPSDVVTWNDRRYRLDRVELHDGQSKWELTRDRASAYSSNATGSNGVTLPTNTPGLAGPTVLQVLNLPSLRSADNVPGVYVAVCGLLPAWPGCDLYLSVDGGVSESQVARIIDPCTMGWLTAALAVGGATLSVNLYSDDTLESVTAEQLAQRMNGAAITSGGVSEILQFQTATDTGVRTYDLTTLTRAGLGTTEAGHGANDSFVLLDGSVLFLPVDVALAGQTLIFRAVTLGTDPDDAETVSIVFDPPTFVIDGGEVTP